VRALNKLIISAKEIFFSYKFVKTCFIDNEPFLRTILALAQLLQDRLRQHPKYFSVHPIQLILNSGCQVPLKF